MCSIVGSKSIEKFKELYKLNAYRGQVTSSFAVFEDECLFSLNRFDKPLPDTVFDSKLSKDIIYFLGHSQAPTSTTETHIHPAEYKQNFLWHNGIIKPEAIALWNKELGTKFTWDTELLLHIIVNLGWDALSEVNGSFACVMYSYEDIFIFRNEIAPLFYDTDLNISSTKFEYSTPFPPNKVFKLFDNKFPIAEFKTKENPYYFGE